MTMQLISSVTVGSGGAASIDFTSIPQTGTDLLLVYSTRSTGGTNNTYTKFNNSTTGYTAAPGLVGTGSAAASTTYSYDAVRQVASSDTANTFSNSSMYIPNYAGSTNKSYSVDTVTENNATAARAHIVAGLWSNTSAITSIIITGDANFAQYSTVSLYTITKGSGGATVS